MALGIAFIEVALVIVFVEVALVIAIFEVAIVIANSRWLCVWRPSKWHSSCSLRGALVIPGFEVTVFFDIFDESLKI